MKIVDLIPYEKKYYGTKIGFLIDDLKAYKIDLWLNGNKIIPSERELNKLKITRQQFDNNELIDGEFTVGEIFDSTHYEDQLTYIVSKLIVDKLNEKKSIDKIMEILNRGE